MKPNLSYAPSNTNHSATPSSTTNKCSKHSLNYNPHSHSTSSLQTSTNAMTPSNYPYYYNNYKQPIYLHTPISSTSITSYPEIINHTKPTNHHCNPISHYKRDTPHQMSKITHQSNQDTNRIHIPILSQSIHQSYQPSHSKTYSKTYNPSVKIIQSSFRICISYKKQAYPKDSISQVYSVPSISQIQNCNTPTILMRKL